MPGARLAAAETITSDSELLARYVCEGSQDAFARLVARHVDLVYNAARRQTHNYALAQDVAQAVFLMLVIKAPSLWRNAIVPAWLLRTTWFACKNALRRERRRRVYEAKVAALRLPFIDPAEPPPDLMVRRALDGALRSLPEAERAAVAMHYLQGRSYEEVGATLHTTPDAARKRVARALPKLRAKMARCGHRFASPAAVEASLTAESAVTTPRALAAKINATVGIPPSGKDLSAP